MPAEIVPGEFCASWFGTYEVTGTNGTKYVVDLSGGEGPASCTCPAFKYAKGPVYDRTCKHIAQVHQEACLWNCQWHDGNEVKMRPKHTYGQVIPDSHCPNCNGPTVAVRIAV